MSEQLASSVTGRRFSRRDLLKGAVAVTVGATALGAGTLSFARFETTRLVVERIEVSIDGLHAGLDGFKIVQMSDFHLYPLTRIGLIESAVAMANRLKPDLVALTGDYVWRERIEAIDEIGPVLARLNARHGIFTVMGNHDLFNDEHVIRAGLERSGLETMKNEGVTISQDNGQIYLAGLDDGWHGRPDLETALAGHARDLPVILLAHEPDQADDFTRGARVSLQLSGHSHGGQLRIPGRGAPFLPPYAYKYDQGLYRVNDAWVYTTRGIGTTVMPIRINCPPEITEITLVRA